MQKKPTERVKAKSGGSRRKQSYYHIVRSLERFGSETPLFATSLAAAGALQVTALHAVKCVFGGTKKCVFIFHDDEIFKNQ